MQQAPLRQDGSAGLVSLPLAELFTIAAEYERADRLEDAERLVAHILAAAPTQADALHLGGIVSFRRKRHEEALTRMELALRHGIDMPLYLRNIGEVYRALGRLDDALAAGLRAAALAPSDPLCRHNLAVIHYHRLELDECLAAAEAALAFDPTLPGAHFAKAEALLLRGDYVRGFAEYEWRFRITGAAAPMPPTDRPQWDGAPLGSQTLLLVADQGFGDAIQFMRYVPWAASLCPNFAIAASAEVAPLLRQIAPGAPVFQNWNACPPFAAFSTLSGLPYLHRTQLETIPWSGPYLRSDPTRRAVWADRMAALLPAGYKRIGIVWAGRPTHNNDRNRSITLAALEGLSRLPRIALVSLQKGPAAGQTGNWFGRAPLAGLGPQIEDYHDTMAILDNIDLLITIDSSVGHLAGAMGLAVWLMLPHAPDWRWLLDRETSPWYPAHRLFRQDRDRSWSQVLERVVAALGELPPGRSISVDRTAAADRGTRHLAPAD